MTSYRRAAGALEADVLATLWSADRPLAARDVLNLLRHEDRTLAYTTVQTILMRLHGKGAVQRTPAGRAHVYTPVLDQDALAANRMRALLERHDNRPGVLRRFVGALSDEDSQTLARLVRELNEHPTGDGDR